ncbi:MAG TPA: nucleotidyltransferase family protein [Gemmatimonadaceae bacterium]|nr:nucleotidyltransferase family protein [Gemmatimonadaceae bacterium]
MSDVPRRVAAVVLAAGDSTRLGVPKQLIEFRGTSLVRAAAIAAGDAGASVVIVVLGASAPSVAQALEGLPHIATVSNDRWRDGLASSLATGIREVLRLDARCDGVLITMADQPLVNSESLRRVLNAFDPQTRLVAAEYSGTIGVPAVIGREHLDALLLLEGDAGAGRWLRGLGDAVRRIPLPEAALDIDTAEDLALLAALRPAL